MGLVYRNGRIYYYRSIRIGDKVISQYVGAGDNGLLLADIDYQKRTNTKQQKTLVQTRFAQYQQADNEIKSLENQLKKLFACIALDNGYHHTKNREWRKKRQ